MTAEHVGVLVDAFAPPVTLEDAIRVASHYAEEGYTVWFERAADPPRLLLFRRAPTPAQGTNPALCSAETEVLGQVERILQDVQGRAARLTEGRNDAVVGAAQRIKEQAAKAEGLVSLVLRGPQPGDAPEDAEAAGVVG